MTAATAKRPKAKTILNREEWLLKAVERLRPIFHAAQECLGDKVTRIPKKVRVSVGFPSRRGLAKKKTVIGECWHGDHRDDGIPHIFISPLLDAALEDEGGALVTLVHELCHACAPCSAKHGPKFARIWQAVGLIGKPTEDHAGEELKKELTRIAKELGPYPHKKLVPPADLEKKDKCRLLKLVCKCKRILRATRKVIDEGGISCDVCGRYFREEKPEEDEDEDAS